MAAMSVEPTATYDAFTEGFVQPYRVTRESGGPPEWGPISIYAEGIEYLSVREARSFALALLMACEDHEKWMEEQDGADC